MNLKIFFNKRIERKSTLKVDILICLLKSALTTYIIYLFAFSSGLDNFRKVLLDKPETLKVVLPILFILYAITLMIFTFAEYTTKNNKK